MKGDELLLELLPEKCLLDELHDLLLANVDLIIDYCGTGEASKVVDNFHREEVEKIVTSERGILFSQEGARIWKEDKEKWVNPRDVVLALYLAIEALRLGKGRDSGAVMQWKRALEISALDFMTFTVEDYAMYPMFEWASVKFSKDDQMIVVGWIQSGRGKIER